MYFTQLIYFLEKTSSVGRLLVTVMEANNLSKKSLSGKIFGMEALCQLQLRLRLRLSASFYSTTLAFHQLTACNVTNLKIALELDTAL